MKLFAMISSRVARLSVGFRLFGGFGLLLVFALVLGGVGFHGMRQISSSVSDIVNFNNAKLGLATSMSRAISEQEKGLLKLLSASDNAQREAMQRTIAYQKGQYDGFKAGLVDIMGLSTPTSFETAIFEKIKAHESGATALVAKVGQLLDADQSEEAAKLMNDEVSPALGKWVGDLDELMGIEQRLNDAAAIASQKEFTLLSRIQFACVALAVILGTFAATLITHSLRRELGGEPREGARIAREIAAGNLAVEIPLKPGDSVSLMVALGDTVKQLTEIIRSMNSAADTISTGASEIASGNMDLSDRTEKQAAALEQIAATMDELTASVNQAAQNAQRTNQLASGASDVAVKGGEVVGQVVATMATINASSKRIGDIIGVIDGIAFQTNILALNAAVEAARAGEQGRGFAVVASEVRNLAQRSAAAAKEIKGLIDASVQTVEEGGRLVDNAGQTMNEIVTAVGRVTAIIAEAATTSNEQASGISQVNQAIAEMDKDTQRNAALVEQSAAAAASMQQQAQELVRQVSIFRLAREA